MRRAPFSWLIILLLVCGASGLYSQWISQLYPKEEDCITFTVTGDIMQHRIQIDDAKRGDDYVYSSCFTQIAPYLKGSDFTIGNLELTFAGKPYAGYPMFSAPDEFLGALKNAGFSVLTTANNHSSDRKDRGIKRTLRMLDRAKIHHVGTYFSKSDRSKNVPLYLKSKGRTVAVLAYTYGTNGIVLNDPSLVDIIDTLQMRKDIATARRNADAVIVAMHWGDEYQLKPNLMQQELWKWLYDHGVSVVIGNHPHVIQPMACWSDERGKMRGLCLYSLGNFISAQETFPRAGSMLVHFSLRFDEIGAYIEDAEYLLTQVKRVESEDGYKAFQVEPFDFQHKVADADSYGRLYIELSDSLFSLTQALVKPVHRRQESIRPPRNPSRLAGSADYDL